MINKPVTPDEAQIIKLKAQVERLKEERNNAAKNVRNQLLPKMSKLQKENEALAERLKDMEDQLTVAYMSGAADGRKQSEAQIDELKAQNKRLWRREGAAEIQLCYETEDYPFNKIELKHVDFGVSDNIYIVESDFVQGLINGASKQAQQEHDDALIEKCADECDCYPYRDSQECADAIRRLKSNKEQDDEHHT